MEIEYVNRLLEGKLPEKEDLAKSIGQCRCNGACGCTSRYSQSVLKEYISMLE